MWESGNLAMFDRAMGDRPCIGIFAKLSPIHWRFLTAQSNMARLPDCQIADEPPARQGRQENCATSACMLRYQDANPPPGKLFWPRAP